jgi:hypothetical protein
MVIASENRAWNTIALSIRADHPNPPNSDQYRRAEYLPNISRHGWGGMNWDKAQATSRSP